MLQRIQELEPQVKGDDDDDSDDDDNQSRTVRQQLLVQAQTQTHFLRRQF